VSTTCQNSLSDSMDEVVDNVIVILRAIGSRIPW
jgi:hypothetical protein